MKFCNVGELKKCLEKLPDDMEIRIDYTPSPDWLRITEVRAEHELFNQDGGTSSYLEFTVDVVERIGEDEDDEEEKPQTLADIVAEAEKEKTKIDLDKS